MTYPSRAPGFTSGFWWGPYYLSFLSCVLLLVFIDFPFFITTSVLSNVFFLFYLFKMFEKFVIRLYFAIGIDQVGNLLGGKYIYICYSYILCMSCPGLYFFSWIVIVNGGFVVCASCPPCFGNKVRHVDSGGPVPNPATIRKDLQLSINCIIYPLYYLSV